MSPTEPTRQSPGLLRRTFLAALLVACAAGPAFGQGLDLFGEKKAVGIAGGKAESALTIETTLVGEHLEPGAIATLSIAVTIPEGFHLYSTDAGYTGRAKITLTETPGLEPLGEFTPDHPPKREFDATLDQEVEKFTSRVVWTRPLRIVDPAAAKIAGSFSGTYCSSGTGGLCLRANEKLAAALARAATPSEGSAGGVFTSVETPQVGDEPGPATLRFSLSPETAKTGETVTLTATMTLADSWHTYSITQGKVPGAQPTVLALERSQGLTPIGESFVADREPEHKTLETEQGDSAIEEHAGTVTWTRQFRVDDAAYGVEGFVRYVTCKDELCLRPQTIAFALGSLDAAGPVPAALPAETADPLAEAFGTTVSADASLPLYLALAFLGGLILNVMPCVLPVVAIKAMSFVQHAGEDRGRIFLLNAVYAAGVISVFLFLAALSVLPEWFGWLFRLLGRETGEFNWGGLFQSDAFNLVMACVVFAMGLSLLGVFEIPIPGMIGSAAGSASREGLSGAFLTGIFATLLATPCLGPFVGGVLFWSLKQPPSVAFLVWATMGLGMASPYLVFGLVPGAVRLLPKPGTWMVQLKQFAGFVLMATVVWLLSSVKTDIVIPVLIVMLGISLALWLIGMVQFSASPVKRRAVTAAAIALGLGVGAFGYVLTLEPTNKLAWQPFSTERVNALRAEGKPILIDFTADWCFNCKTNERLALNTIETKALIEKHGVVPLVADFTDESDEIKQWLDRFGVIGVPLTVIFPAERPNDPIVLEGVYSQGTLLKRLDEAVHPPAPARAAAVKTAETR